MAPKRPRGTPAEESNGVAMAADSETEGVRTPRQTTLGSRDPLVIELTNMFQSYLQVQERREERMEREGARQEQRWKAMQHQFTQLQEEVQRSCQAEGEGEKVNRPHTSTEQLAEPWRSLSMGWREPVLQRLEATDDIEQYLTTFERMATAYAWEKASWAIKLVPLLTGKARSAFVAMNTEETMDYEKVKEAVLKKYEINIDTYRQRFRAMSVLSEETPQELYVRLRDLYKKWIKPEKHTKQEIGELLILEQYLRMVNHEVRVWIKEHNPSSALEAARLVETFVAARRGPKNYHYSRGPSAPVWGKSEGFGKGVGHAKVQNVPIQPGKTDRPRVVCYNCGQEGHIKPNCPLKKPKSANLCYVPRPSQWLEKGIGVEQLVQIFLYGKTLPALLDTGSSQTLVRSEFIPRECVNEGATLRIKCIHGEERPYPTADVYLGIADQTFLVTVGVVTELPYPVLIGQDIPILGDLVQQSKPCSLVITRSKSSPCQDEENTLKDMPFVSEELEGGLVKSRKSRRERRRERLRGTVQKNQEIEMFSESDGAEEFDVPENLEELQRADSTLQHLYEKVGEIEGEVQEGGVNLKEEHYVLTGGLLYRKTREETQLVIPQVLRSKILNVGHTVPWAGHLGKHKTLARISARFFWPGLYSEVSDYIKSCPECQLACSGGKVGRAPLISLPIIDIPFERIAMDVVGPLEKSRSGNRFMLVICDYATRYPEVFPLRNVKAKQVATALLKLFSRVGIPREVLTDQGTNFRSQLLKQVYRLLGIKAIKTTPYHPQTDGLVERYNRTLKSMLCKFVSDTGSDWDQWIPYLLFAYREVPQSSTGFSPFELLYGRQVRGPLDILKEEWESKSPERQNIASYVLKMRDQLERMSTLARENITEAQKYQKTWYDKKARSRSFIPGQKVLLLLPTKESKLLAKWQGPFEVLGKKSPVTYEIAMPDRRKPRQMFHINLLKEWYPRQEEVSYQMFIRVVEEEEEEEQLYLPPKGQTGSWDLSHLTHEQQEQIMTCLSPEVFRETPGITNLVHHQIQLKENSPIRQWPYRVPERLLSELKTEVELMISLGVIEESNSEWSSPIVLVPKKDGSLRFCIDFRKINAVSKFDPYPMPRIDEMVEKLGKAKYISTLDLCKGYWQVPLAPESKEITAFRTPLGHFQFTVMPFGLQGAPATFQRLMNQVLRGAENFAAAYLDDIVIYSQNWEEHLGHLRWVIEKLQQAGLSANPKKCALAKQETKYLGYHLGSGVLRPQVEKVEAIMQCTPPATKKQVRSFLGLIGWYRRFIPDFSTKAAVLTELTKKASPNKVRWTPTCEEAFNHLKQALCQDPVLQSPDFDQPFVLQTDASGVGLGAALLQGEPENLRPVLYISRKLFPREVNYSTIEKECLAIKWALDSLRYYLLGRTFTLETDHRALQWLGKMKDSNARITRWYLTMQPFSYEIKYRPGVQNKTADFLSRIPEEHDKV